MKMINKMGNNKIKEEIEREILSCKNCNVTKDKGWFDNKDSFEFNNFCLVHKEKLIRFDERKQATADLIKKIEEFWESKRTKELSNEIITCPELQELGVDTKVKTTKKTCSVFNEQTKQELLNSLGEKHE